MTATPNTSLATVAAAGALALAAGSGVPVQALTEGALTASDLVIPSVVLYQGTSQERKKSWFSDNLKPGDILLTDGTLMNGTFNPATRERTNAFGVLKVNKYFVLYEPRNAESQGGNRPIIQSANVNEIRARLTPEFLADHGWVPGEAFDAKEGTYVEAQLEDPTEWVDGDGDANTPPLMTTIFEFTVLYEDMTLAIVRFASRRDGDKAGAALFTAVGQSGMSPLPWMFILTNAERVGAVSKETWFGLSSKRAGLATPEYVTAYKHWITKLASLKVVAAEDNIPV